MKKILLLSLALMLLCWGFAYAANTAGVTANNKNATPAPKFEKVDGVVQQQAKQTTASNKAETPVVKSEIKPIEGSAVTSDGKVIMPAEEPVVIQKTEPPVKGQTAVGNPNDTKYHGPATTPTGWSPSMATVNLLTEGFEGGALPAGWLDEGGFPWLYNNGTFHGPGAPHSGSFTAYYDIWNYPTGSNDNLVTSSMDFSAHSGSYIVSFWGWHSSGGDSMNVFVRENGVDRFLYHMPNTGSWTLHAIPFTSTAADGRIVFRGYSRFGSYNIYIDDVSVDDYVDSGRCCYGDPYNPSCAVNTSAECAALSGTWTYGETCANPCPTLAGDDCAHTLAITSFPYTDTRSFAGYGNQYNAHGPDVVYQFTIAERSLMDFTLCNTVAGFDTWMGLWADPNCGAATFLLSDDDGCGYPPGLSHISNAILEAGTYYLLVEPYSSTGSGTYTLDVTSSPAPLAPANDECANAEAITGPYPVDVYGTNIGATADCPGQLDWNGVWYSIDLPYAVNEVSVDWCLTTEGAIQYVGIVYETECCGPYSFWTYTWPTCGSGLVEPLLQATIAGPTTILLPAWVSADPGGAESPMNFGFTVNVTEYVPPAADFEVTAPGQWTDPAVYNTCGAGNDCNLRTTEEQIFAVTIPTDGGWIFSLCNTSPTWDTWMALGTSSCASDIAINDDFCGLLSQITASLTAGVYYLTVEGYSGCGAYTLDIYEAPPAPPNDLCQDVNPADFPLSDGVPVVYTGDNTGAMSDCSQLGWAEVWIPFQTTECMDVTIAACGTQDYLGTLGIWMFDACPCGNHVVANAYNWTECTDGQWTAHFYGLPAGTWYYPLYSAAVVGPYTITVTGVVCPPPPANDNCIDAIAIGDVTNEPFSTRSATFDGTGACQTASNVWYVYTASCDGNAVVSLCGSTYDTKMAVYDGFDCTQSIQIGCNDDACGLQSQVTFPAVAGNQYLIEVGGFSTATGDGVISTACFVPPPNDNCADVTPVDLPAGGTVTFTGNNGGSSQDCPLGSWPEVWEAITTTECMDITIDYCGTDPAFGNVYIVMTGECPCGTFFYANNWDNTSCDGNWTVRFLSVPAGTWYLPILTEGGSMGPYVMNVTGTACPPPPANDNCIDAMAVGEVQNLEWNTIQATFDGAGVCVQTPNIWFLYTPTVFGPMSISLCGSALDTKMAVYDGSECPETMVLPDPSPLQGGETIETAVPLGTLPAVYTGSTAIAINDYDEACTYTGSLSPDVVYSYVPSVNETVDMYLCGSTYDTKMYVYENVYTPGAPFACNDDAFYCTGDPYKSALLGLGLTAGNTYYIVVDGYGSASGDYLFTMFSQAAANYVLLECNDDFCGLQSQVTIDAQQGHQYLIEVGGFSGVGTGVLTIAPPPPDPCDNAVYSNGTATGFAYASQCAPGYPFAAGAADDFILPGTDPVNIGSIAASFNFWNGTGTPDLFPNVVVTIYANDPATNLPGGNPVDGDPNCAHVETIEGGIVFTETVPAGTFTWYLDGANYRVIVPVTGLTLTPGITYWLEVMPQMEFPPQCGWVNTDAITGFGAVQIFPLAGLPTWTAPSPGVDFSFCLIPAGGAGCDYEIGDINGNGARNGLDVVYGVSYFKGGPPPPYSCECTPGNTWFVSGDVNGSCNFNGLDISYLVSYFKGGPLPIPCADCPPARILLAPKPVQQNGAGQ